MPILFQRGDPLEIRNNAVQLVVNPRIGSVHRQDCPAGRHVHVLKLAFHLSSKVFRPKEFMNPFVELRDAGVVPSAETHEEIVRGMNQMGFQPHKR